METTKKLDSYLNEFTHADNSEAKTEPNGAGMSKSELYHIANMSKELHDMIDDNYPLDDWMEAKLTKAADYVKSVYQSVVYDIKGEGDETTNEHTTIYITTPDAK
tara:strand:- start:1265 stop:1579 length:315 start_codon:yes stop_codon:yes gene_type:complete